MKRDYFIGADICYQLTDKPTPINLYYYTKDNVDKEFLSFQTSGMIDHTEAQILILESNTIETFIHYPLEKEL
jgi:hypothetical protein